ncbi:MAG TPA: phosphatase PAP2 family protein [Holophagaceae bacterium]|nr:phosphatase PAP2 family protein [Holophagaceae bacterium]
MRRVAALILSTALVAQPAPRTDRTTKALKGVGELGKYGLPATALILSLIHGSKEDTAAFMWSFGTTAILTEAIKRGAPKQRPDFSDTDGFPSGHTAAAFSGALFIQDREGWAWGGPALGIAALTAYGRVRNGEHGWDDVMGGFGIALVDHFALASSQPGRRLWIAPWTDEGATGVQMGLQAGGGSPSGAGRFELWMSDPQLERRNPSPLFATDPERAPTASMRLMLHDERGDWTFQAAPQTTQSYRTLAAPQPFAGGALPAGINLASQTALLDLRGAYTWRLGNAEEGGSLGAGAGLGYGSHEESFALPDRPWTRRQSQALLPILRGACAWDPAPWVEARLSIEAGSLSRNRMKEAAAEVEFRFSHGFGLEAAWRNTEWTFRNDAAAESLLNRGLSLGVVVAW